MDRAREPSAGGLGVGGALVASGVALALAGAVFAGGASGPGGTLPVGGIALLVLAASLVAVGLGRLPVPNLGRSGALLAASLVALVGWSGATIAWSIAPDRSWDALNKGLAFAVFLGLGAVFSVTAGRVAARAHAARRARVIGAARGWGRATKTVPS
ncbi:MAG: hypothetical protein NZL88_09070, partial [Gaiellaceae bacterium]|nr:hypothetical protein [Gaiellaceae bacterium]